MKLKSENVNFNFYEIYPDVFSDEKMGELAIELAGLLSELSASRTHKVFKMVEEITRYNAKILYAVGLKHGASLFDGEVVFE